MRCEIVSHSNGNHRDCVHSLFSSFLFGSFFFLVWLGSVCSHFQCFCFIFFWHILLVRTRAPLAYLFLSFWHFSNYFVASVYLLCVQNDEQLPISWTFVTFTSKKKFENNNFGFGVGSIELDLCSVCIAEQTSRKFDWFFYHL